MILRTITTISIAAVLLAGCSNQAVEQNNSSRDKLSKAFQMPSDSVKPWVMWFWISDFVSKQAITYDIEAYKRSGVNGLLIFPNYEHVDGWNFKFSIKGLTKNRVQPLSNEWYECVRHAIKEAERLGMQLCFHNEPGYSGAGGPWVNVAHSIRKLVDSETIFQGPGLFGKELPVAQGLDYQDIAVLAFKITDEKLGNIKNLPIPVENIIDLTSQYSENGVLNWSAPEGIWKITRYGHISTGKKIHPASPVAEGYESDKMNPEAVRHHFEKGMIGRILALEPELNGSTVVGVELDSYEGGNSDWTQAFHEEFLKRRGYNPLPWLPAWQGKEVVASSLQSEKFRYDMKRTISELHADNYYNEAAAFCRERNVALYTESYGTSLWDPLTTAGRADVPMAEFWLDGHNKLISTVRMMASAAHTTGKNVITAEAYTYSPSPDPWQFDPYSFKRLGDLAYCLGLNHTILSEASLQFWEDRVKPGMTFDAWGTPFSVNQTWWKPGRAWMEYQARCHALLQQGHFVADILILSPFPSKGFNHWNGPDGISYLHRNYNFDLCSEEVFLNNAQCRNGVIVLGEMEYRILQLINSEQLRPQVMTKLAELVQQGATVIGVRPAQSPGLEGGEESNRHVTETAAMLWGNLSGGMSKGENIFGKGQVIQGRTSEQMLLEMGIPPDVEVTSEITWIHRKTDDADIYFLSNQEQSKITADVIFRVNSRKPELWDPVTGEIRSLEQFEENGDRTTVPLTFEPHQSWFVVFSYRDKEYLAKSKKNFPDLIPLMDITGEWTVNFDEKWSGLCKEVTFDKLVDWTKRPESGIKYYSGTAKYKKIFNSDFIIPETVNLEPEIYIDLGKVKNLAEVSLNGTLLGIIWCPPWRIRIQHGLLKEKGNILEIRVTNTWVNRLIGDEQEPVDAEWSEEYDKAPFINKHTRSLLKEPEWLANNDPRPSKGRFAFVTYKHYLPTDSLRESGLLGPIKLMLTSSQ